MRAANSSSNSESLSRSSFRFVFFFVSSYIVVIFMSLSEYQVLFPWLHRVFEYKLSFYCNSSGRTSVTNFSERTATSRLTSYLEPRFDLDSKQLSNVLVQRAVYNLYAGVCICFSSDHQLVASAKEVIAVSRVGASQVATGAYQPKRLDARRKSVWRERDAESASLFTGVPPKTLVD